MQVAQGSPKYPRGRRPLAHVGVDPRAPAERQPQPRERERGGAREGTAAMANARRDGVRPPPSQIAVGNVEDGGGPEIAGIRFQSWPGGRDYDHSTFWHRG